MQLTIYLTPQVPLSLGGVKGEGKKERGASPLSNALLNVIYYIKVYN
jgi:hypothetical protein